MNANKNDVNTVQESPWLTATEAAEYLRLSLKTVRNYTYRGQIPYYRTPQTGTLRYLKAELDAWLRQSAKGPERYDERSVK